MGCKDNVLSPRQSQRFHRAISTARKNTAGFSTSFNRTFSPTPVHIAAQYEAEEIALNPDCIPKCG